MQEFTGQHKCVNCGKALRREQVYRRQKYCSRQCSNDTRFGKKVRWGKIETRRPMVIEAAKLCRAGKTQAEAAKIVGVHPQTVSNWFTQYGADNIIPDRVCAYCGKPLAGIAKSSKRKYCGERCGDNARYARAHFANGRKRAKKDPARSLAALELYWGGLDSASIARHLGIPLGTVDSWIYRSGSLREIKETPEAMARRPLKQRLRDAEDVMEWAQILREAAGGDPGGAMIRLVCGIVDGKGEINGHTTVVLDRLKLNPCSGEIFAFCNKGYNIITTIQWWLGAFRLTRIPKRRGNYLWPGDGLGLSVTVTVSEFEHLLSYQKNMAHTPEKA